VHADHPRQQDDNELSSEPDSVTTGGTGALAAVA
jgi:hypothetical protein